MDDDARTEGTGARNAAPPRVPRGPYRCRGDDSPTVLDAERALHALAGHLQCAREADRSLIARELQDDLGSSLTLLVSSSSALRARVPGSGPLRNRSFHGPDPAG